MGMTQRDVVGREVGGGFMGTHVRIKDFKIKKKKKPSSCGKVLGSKVFKMHFKMCNVRV